MASAQIKANSKSRLTIACVYNALPPDGSAVALRGSHFLRAIRENEAFKHADIIAFTNTANAREIPGVHCVVPLAQARINQRGYAVRILGEAITGLLISLRMLSPKSRCNFLLVSSPMFLCALAITRVARWLRVPYALDLRDPYPDVYVESGLIRSGSCLWRFLERANKRMCCNAVIVLTAMDSLKKQVERNYYLGNVHGVYNGFPAEFLSRESSKHSRFTVVFHGNLGVFQDIETLIRIARKLSSEQIDIVVIGAGKKAQVLSRGAPDNLRFLGNLSFDATIREVERCHVGLSLRRDDGVSRNVFPVKVWEYFGLSIPSIITPPSEAGDFIRLRGCGLVFKAGDVEGIAHAITGLRGNPQLLSEMVANCVKANRSYTREALSAHAAQLIAGAFCRQPKFELSAKQPLAQS
jgi:glycosyltransferase involved in cell wall biosynthesis